MDPHRLKCAIKTQVRSQLMSLSIHKVASLNKSLTCQCLRILEHVVIESNQLAKKLRNYCYPGFARSTWEVDNLDVVRHVGRIFDDIDAARPLVMMNDGDPLTLVQEKVLKRSEGTTRATKVKGHVDEQMVLLGRGREDDRIGDDLVDEAAEAERLSVYEAKFSVKCSCFDVPSYQSVTNHTQRFITASVRFQLAVGCEVHEVEFAPDHLRSILIGQQEPHHVCFPVFQHLGVADSSFCPVVVQELREL